MVRYIAIDEDIGMDVGRDIDIDTHMLSKLQGRQRCPCRTSAG